MIRSPSYARTLATAALALLVVAGCKTDDPTPNDAGDTGVADGGETGTTQVTGAVQVSFKPALHVYRTDSSLTGVATVYDLSGSEVSDADVTWSAKPSEAAEKVGTSKFKLKKEGTVTIQACATLDAGREICGSKGAVVDAGPPSVELTKPKAGAMLGGSGNTDKITVEGKVTDSHGSVSAFVNGRGVELADDGTFSTKIPAEFGLNAIRLTATDGLNQTHPSVRRQVVWAPGYKSVSTSGSNLQFNDSKGVGFNIGQNFFDDARPPHKNSSDSTIVARDLADVMNLLVTNINLANQLPNPLINNSAAELRINSVKLGQPIVMVDITDNGLNGYLHIDQLLLQTSGNVTIEGQQLSLNGSIGGRASAFVEVSIARNSSGDFTTQVDTLELSIDEVKPSFADKKANAIFKLAEGALRSEFEQRFKKILRKQIIGTLPDLVDKQLNSLQKTLSKQTFQFGTQITGSRTVSFSGDVDSFATAFRRHVRGILKATVGVNGKDSHSSAAGIPLIAPNTKEIPWFDQSRLQIALRLRIINGLMTSIWKSGFLDTNLKSALPDKYKNALSKAKLSAKLPPVVRPAEKTEPYDLVLEVGQLELDTEAIGKDDLYGLRLNAGVNVALKDNDLKLKVPDKPTVEAWVIEKSKESAFVPPDQLETVILNKFWPSLKKTLKGGLALQLPAPSLSGLSNISPTLSKLMLNYELARAVAVRDGFVMLDAGFKGVLPLGN